MVPDADDAATRRVLALLEQQVQIGLGELDQILTSLAQDSDIDVFPFDSAMMQKAADFALEKLDLQPFDQAILASILGRTEMLRSSGETEFAFCELDGDLQPWDKQGKKKEPLTALYDNADVWVYSDFVLKFPRRPDKSAGRSEVD